MLCRRLTCTYSVLQYRFCSWLQTVTVQTFGNKIMYMSKCEIAYTVIHNCVHIHVVKIKNTAQVSCLLSFCTMQLTNYNTRYEFMSLAMQLHVRKNQAGSLTKSTSFSGLFTFKIISNLCYKMDRMFSCYFSTQISIKLVLLLNYTGLTFL